eukprot:TRINITY_DN38989_c0_g1_i2.p1 TRINITY_DN38989_c0_g1~~TRINITY_DN38989_c0_g1_i2.p1  ORF type:complete len:196 (-),score=20.08 TRINITY_DN38989_c0_g1_i2:9-596(-)
MHPAIMGSGFIPLPSAQPYFTSEQQPHHIVQRTAQQRLRALQEEIHPSRFGFVSKCAAAAVLLLPGRRVHAKCRNIDECREIGDRRAEEADVRKGPIVSLGKGIRYRETRPGIGRMIGKDDVVDVSYEVRYTSGVYIYSQGRGRPENGQDDFGDTYRVRLGQHDVPVAVEMAMEGMREGVCLFHRHVLSQRIEQA